MSEYVQTGGEPGQPEPPAPPPRGPRIWMVALAAVGAGVLLGIALAFLGEDDDRTDQVADDSTSSPGESPSATGSPSPPGTTEPTTTPTASPTAGEPRTLGLYYLGEQAEGEWWLYREFRTVEVTDGRPVLAAVNAMFTVRPLDQDYTNPWPEGSRVISTSKSGDTATIDLSATAAAGQAPEDISRLALQQLVHTATAADPEVRQIRLLVDGRELTRLWGHPVGEQPIARAPQGDVLGPVWIIDPIEGATVGRRFTVRGSAEVFEATVSYEIREGGETIDDGAVTASAGSGTRGDWSLTLTLDPGSYELRFFYDSAQTGEPEGVDTKTIRVS